MLKSLQRFFNAPQEVVTMVEPQEQAETLAVPNTAEFSALVAQMASQTEAFSAVEAQLAELTTKYAEAQSQLSAIEADKAALQATAKAKVLATRQEKLEAIMGTTKAPGVAAALENLDDATFETVLGTYAASYEAEANSAMFKEAGVSAEVAPVEQDAVQKLAASLAAQFNVK